MSMQNFVQKLEMNMQNCKKNELHKYQNYFESMPQKLYQKPSYRKPLIKTKNYIMMNLKKLKKVILMLQKFEDVLKTKEE